MKKKKKLERSLGPGLEGGLWPEKCNIIWPSLAWQRAFLGRIKGAVTRKDLELVGTWLLRWRGGNQSGVTRSGVGICRLEGWGLRGALAGPMGFSAAVGVMRSPLGASWAEDIPGSGSGVRLGTL